MNSIAVPFLLLNQIMIDGRKANLPTFAMFVHGKFLAY